MAKKRVDERVVELGLETNRSRARARILAGDVRLGDRVLDKPGNLIDADAELVLKQRARFVSRGGEKLVGALSHFEIDPTGWRCVDVGASTGGFTDCLLQHGAVSVLALDVGYGQLELKLREDSRVEVLERTNIRHFKPAPDLVPFDFLTADLSFIGLRRVLSHLIALVAPGGQLLLLVKPQFELGPEAVGPGGVVRDLAERERASRLVAEQAKAQNLLVLGEVESALPGPKGNRERFLWLSRPAADK